MLDSARVRVKVVTFAVLRLLSECVSARVRESVFCCVVLFCLSVCLSGSANASRSDNQLTQPAGQCLSHVWRLVSLPSTHSLLFSIRKAALRLGPSTAAPRRIGSRCLCLCLCLHSERATVLLYRMQRAPGSIQIRNPELLFSPLILTRRSLSCHPIQYLWSHPLPHVISQPRLSFMSAHTSSCHRHLCLTNQTPGPRPSHVCFRNLTLEPWPNVERVVRLLCRVRPCPARIPSRTPSFSIVCLSVCVCALMRVCCTICPCIILSMHVPTTTPYSRAT